MTPTLEDLRAEWSACQQRIEQSRRVHDELAREAWIATQRELIRRAPSFGWINTLVWVLVLAALAAFALANLGHPRFLLPAAVLISWTLPMGIVSLRQQRGVRALDFSLPVVVLQERLQALRIARLRTFNVAFLTGQVVWWIPFAIVAMRGILGVDLYRIPGFTLFALANMGVGLAVIPLAIWGARRWGERLSRFRPMRAIADSLAGRDLAAARAALDRLRRFERAP